LTAFRYEAARADGASVRGVLEVGSEAEATALLSARGLYPVRVEPAPASAKWRLGRPSSRAQATVFQGLASLVEAGLPLEKALRATLHVADGGLREALERVGTRVREGASLGSALAAENGLFSGVTIGLVRAGERGVGLGAALTQTAAQLEREAETAARIRGALAYPTLLAAVGTLSVAVIVIFVVPRFVALLGDLGQTLPLATRILVAASSAVHRFGLALFAVAIGGAVLLGRLARDHREAWHRWLLTVPLIGRIRHALATARVCRTLGALLGTGTPALPALVIASDAAADAAVNARLARVRQQVAEGASLSTALSATGAVTESARQLVSIGEGSGRLPALLAKAADLEEREAERRLKGLVTFLEPALILVFAGLVAFVAAALLQAVYSLRPGGIG
jgi:type II secretory pathway component PulF